MITATGLVVAGFFAYFKFVKGRTFHPRCLMNMDCELVELAKGRMLRVSVTLRNDSQIALLFPSEASQVLAIGEMDRSMWRQSCATGRPVPWEDTKPIIWGLDAPEGQILYPREEKKKKSWRPWRTRSWLRQYVSGDKLEPGEQWARSTLVPVRSGSVAFLLRAEVGACRHFAARHAVRHKFYCVKACEKGTPPVTWWREIFVFPGVHKKWSRVHH
jgi:hypothetical protein